MIDNIIVMIKLTANKEHWTRNSYFQELDIDQKELNLDERRLLTVRTLNFWHILVDLSVTAYVLFLKLFKDCSDISIFWQEKTTCYFKKSSCYDALFTVVEHSEIDWISGVVTKCESARRRGMRGTVPACEASLNSRLARLARLAASRVTRLK